MICAGIDAGSRAIKIALVRGSDSGELEVVGLATGDQGLPHAGRAMELLETLLAQHALALRDVRRTVATGYARRSIPAADTAITEITCHARGVRHLSPAARTVIEIGGQDSKVLRLTPDGTVRDFSMNDRCAAGTGRFLEVVAERLDMPFDQLGEFARRSDSPASISSMCVVFAESEIIGLLSSGAKREDILAGVQQSIATRVAAMAAPPLDPPVVFTGGVAHVGGMPEALGKALGATVMIAPNSRHTGALGAALLAMEETGAQLSGKK